MVPLTLAQKLKEAGLSWTPAKNDFFAIPNRGFDDTVFVISDMTTLLEKVYGQLSVTFYGVAEWALDHIMVAELVWLPTEAQVRELLEQHLVGQNEPALTLTSTSTGYRCQIRWQEQLLAFEAFGAAEVYGLALCHLLETESPLTIP